MTTPYGVIDYNALRRLHQQATDAAQHANENPNDDTAEQVAQSALEAYERGISNYQTLSQRIADTERATRRREHRAPPSEAELYAREGVKGLRGTVEGVVRFPVDVARAVGRSLDRTIPASALVRRTGGRVPSRAPREEGPGLGELGRGLVTMGYNMQSSLMEPDITGPERFGRIVGMLGNVGLLAAGRAGGLAKARTGARAIEASLAQRAASQAKVADETGSLLRMGIRNVRQPQSAVEAVQARRAAALEAEPARPISRAVGEFDTEVARAQAERPVRARMDAERAARQVAAEAERNALREAMDEPARLRALRRQPEAGTVSPQVVGAITGGGLGAVVGGTKGETTGERIKNALILGGLGTLGGGYLMRGRPTPRPTTTALRVPEAPSPTSSRAVEQRIAAATPARTDVAALRPQDYVRADKLGFTDPESVARLNAVAGEAIQAARERGLDWRQPVTWQQTAETAQALGLRPSEIITRVPERLTTAELEALKLVAQRADDAIADVSRRLGDRNLTVDQKLDLETSYDRLWAEYRTVFSHFSRGRSEAGRSLNILRKIADRPLDPLVWQGIAERMHQGPLTTAQMQQVRGLVAAGDREALVRGVAGLRPGRRLSQFVTLLKAGFLSKPSTHARNIGSNIANLMFRNVADVPATLLDAAIAPLTGQRVKSFAGSVGAARRGATEGAAAAARALRQGAAPETVEGWQLTGYGDFDGPIAKGYTEIIFRSLDAEDQLFRRIAYRRAITEEAASLAQTTGLKGAARQAEMQQLLRTPTDEMEAVAAHAAETAVYRQVTPLHAAIEGAKTALRRRGHVRSAAFTEVIAPFTRTPAAVAATALDYSPVGVARAILLDLPRLVGETMKAEPTAIRAAQRTFVERISRGGMGSAGLVLVGYKLRATDMMTGAFPAAPSEQEQWRTEGKTAYAIRWRGRWWGMTGVAPFGTMLALGASYYDARRASAEGEPRKAERALASAVGTLTEQPALQGITRTAEALSDLSGAGARYASNQAAGLVPGLVAGAAQAIDPVVRRPETMTQAVEARIPGLSQRVPARQTIFGVEMARPEGPVGRTLRAVADPFASSRDRTLDDPLIAEIQRVGAVVGPLSRIRDETPEAYRQRGARTGPVVREQLERLVMSDVYRSATIEEQAALIPRIANDARSDVREGRNVHTRPAQALLSIRRAARRAGRP